MADENLDSVIATIVKVHGGTSGKCLIRTVNVQFDKKYKDTPWRTSYYWKHGTMSKYFRTNENFEFHRIGPGRHMVSISPKFKPKGSSKPKKGRAEKIAASARKPRRKSVVQNKRERTVGDHKDYYERKGSELQAEENVMLQKQVEGLQKQAEMRDKSLKKQERDMQQLRVQLEEKNRELKEMQDEIRLLRKDDTRFANVDEESDESDGYVSDDFNLVDDDVEFTKLYHSKKCELMTPKEVKEIKKGIKNFFRVKCPEAFNVAVVVDEDKWHHLRKESEGMFCGNVLVEAFNTFVDVLVKWNADSKFEAILTISMGKSK